MSALFDVQSFSLVAPPAGFTDNPYPIYASLREHSPVHELAPGSYLLTRHADVLAMYRSPQLSSDKQREFKPKLGDSLLYEHHTSSLVFNDPPLHTRVRRLLLGAMNQRAIARMEGGVVALVDGLLDQLADQPAPCLVAHFAAQIPVEVIGNLLDVPHAERAPLRDWSLAILSALEPAPSRDTLARGNAAVRDFLQQLRGLIKHRRAHPGDPEADVLTRLLQGEVDGTRLSEGELLHNCIFLLNAGHETTTNLIGNGLHALMTHPAELRRLVQQPTLLPSAVEELLRFESPLQLNNRVTTAALQLGSGASAPWVPAGSFITLCIGAANHDPEVFRQPEQLDLARKPNPHLAFGQGSHACAGMNVARLEARIAIGRLLARHPQLQLRAAAVREGRVRFRGWRSLPIERLG